MKPSSEFSVKGNVYLGELKGLITFLPPGLPYGWETWVVLHGTQLGVSMTYFYFKIKAQALCQSQEYLAKIKVSENTEEVKIQLCRFNISSLLYLILFCLRGATQSCHYCFMPHPIMNFLLLNKENSGSANAYAHA